MVIEDHDTNNSVLIERLLSGDAAAGDELIVRNIGLVQATVKHVLRLWPSYRHLRQDLVGEGLVILTQLVKQMVEPPTSCFRNLIISMLRIHFFKTLVRHEQPFYAALNLEPTIKDQCVDDHESLRQLEDREFLLKRCENALERGVVCGYLDGFYQREVAERLGVPRQRVIAIFQAYKKRLRAQVVKEFELAASKVAADENS